MSTTETQLHSWVSGGEIKLPNLILQCCCTCFRSLQTIMQNYYIITEDMPSLVSHQLSIIKYVVLKKIFFFLCFDRLIWTWTWTRTSLDLDSNLFGLGLDSDSNLFGLGLDSDSNLFGLGLDSDSNLFGLGLDSDSNLFGLGLVLDSTKVDLTTALFISPNFIKRVIFHIKFLLCLN